MLEQELSLSDGLGDFADEAPSIYNGGLSDDLNAEEALSAPEEV